MTTVSLMGHLTVTACAISLGQQMGYSVGVVGFFELFCLSPGGRVFPLAPRELTNCNLQEGWHGSRTVHKQGCFVMACHAKGAMVIATKS